MRFGTFSYNQSRPWIPEKQAFEELLEQILLTERLGFDDAWFAEHHPNEVNREHHHVSSSTRVDARTVTIFTPPPFGPYIQSVDQVALLPSRGVRWGSGLDPAPHLVGERARALEVLAAGGLVLHQSRSVTAS